MSNFENKKILIIGGTGTVGKALVKRLLKEKAKVIRVFSRDEFKQFEMMQEYGDDERLRFLIGDIRDKFRLEFAMDQIDYVFHLAAMKHVGSCEYNPEEAIKTNVIGTKNVIKAAIKNNVSKVIFSSSDKAINPVNTYGATKLLAEKLFVSEGSNSGSYRTKFSVVRFGNIMGSRGSVIPSIKKQVINNKEVTVTNGQMTRFMMSVSKAVELLLRVVDRADGGETFILKMPCIKLDDLIECIIEETAKKYDINVSKIKKRIIGFRQGEKMYEELMTKDEALKAMEFEDMFVIPSYFKNNKYKEKIVSEKVMDSYRSDRHEIVSREEIRKIFEDEKLI